MKRIFQIRQSKTFLFFLIWSLLAILGGVILYFKIKFNPSQIDLAYIIRNGSLCHILFMSLTFILAFILIGPFLGLIFYCFEIMTLVILGLGLLSSFKLRGILLFLIIFIFKIGYLFLLFYLITRIFKIYHGWVQPNRINSEQVRRYLKQILIGFLICTLIELVNFFWGYKLLVFVGKLLK